MFYFCPISSEKKNKTKPDDDDIFQQRMSKTFEGSATQFINKNTVDLSQMDVEVISLKK